MNVLGVFQRSREQRELQFTKTLHHPILYVIYISKYIALYEIDSNPCLCSNETDEFCMVVFPDATRMSSSAPASDSESDEVHWCRTFSTS